MTTENKELLLRYLLGDLPESERERLEQEYFTTPEVLRTLSAAEDDLVDTYVRGGLSPNQRQQFESYFLASPQKRKRLEFATTLRTALRQQETGPGVERGVQTGFPRQRLIMQTAVAATAVVAILAALLVFLTLQNRNLRQELGKSQSAQIELQRQVQELQEQIKLSGATKGDSEWWPPATGETVSILLSPGLVREIGKPQGHLLAIPRIASSVVLVLGLEEDQYSVYDLVIRTAEGAEIRRIKALKSQPIQNGGRAVIVSLPAHLFDKGDYVVTLFARNDHGQTLELRPYSFTVTR
ncbi:MAG TPA: hypothetical protein VI685_09890 [Candidatus Angelobacter sp.]